MMKQRTVLPLLLVSLLMPGCAAIPKQGDTVFAMVIHIFSADEFRKAQSSENEFKGYFERRDLSMLQAAIDQGVGMAEIKAGRLVAAECSCGAECYSSYPVLLPANREVHRNDLIRLKTGLNQWRGGERRYRFTLGQYLGRVDMPPGQWVRIPGNHGYLPACQSTQWDARLNRGP